MCNKKLHLTNTLWWGFFYTKLTLDIKPGTKNIKLISFLLIYYSLTKKTNMPNKDKHQPLQSSKHRKVTIKKKNPIKIKITTLTKTAKMMLTNETWKKNSGDLVEFLMELSDNNIDFVVKMAKKYTTFIHDYFEENPQISPAIQEQLLKKLNPKWFINKIRNQANN